MCLSFQKNGEIYLDPTKVTYGKYPRDLRCSNSEIGCDIPAKHIKEYSDIFTTVIIKDFNKCMHNGVFSKSFKISPVIPVYKTDETYEKNNYRPHNYTFESVQNL